MCKVGKKGGWKNTKSQSCKPSSNSSTTANSSVFNAFGDWAIIWDINEWVSVNVCVWMWSCGVWCVTVKRCQLCVCACVHCTHTFAIKTFVTKHLATHLYGVQCCKNAMELPPQPSNGKQTRALPFYNNIQNYKFWWNFFFRHTKTELHTEQATLDRNSVIFIKHIGQSSIGKLQKWHEKKNTIFVLRLFRLPSLFAYVSLHVGPV